MPKALKKLIKNKKPLPIIIGAVLALFVAVFLIGAITTSLSGGSAIKIVSAQSVYQSSEIPQFVFVYKNQTNIFVRFFNSVSNLFSSENKKVTATVKIFDTNNKEIDNLNPQIKESNGKFTVDLDHSHFQQELRPGKYRLQFEIKDGEKIYTQEQDFRWGVLAINTNKSIYLSGEEAYLQFASLEDDGHTICNSRLELQIQNPKSKIQTLSTEDGTIEYSGECKGDNVTDIPDYFAHYQVNGAGKYEMKLTNLDNGYEITDYFEVKESAPFEVERIGPTRIYPPADYEIKIIIKANQDFQGEIVETVPMTFAITETAGALQDSIVDNYTKTIIWQANLKKGETKEIIYTFKAPNISPYFYLIGPLKIGEWQESREWQIAADAATTIVLNYVQTILTEGTTWTVPADWNASNSIEVIGGGGAGYSDINATQIGAGGGGGGAYSKIINLSLVAGNTVYYQVASGGDENYVHGNDTFFNRTAGSGGDCEADTTSVCAKGGAGATSATGGSGGAGASCDGTICVNGGNGGTGNTTQDTGGGGGGAGGPGDGETAQAGKNGGIGSTSAVAGEGTGGGGGGNGSAASADGEGGNVTLGQGGLGGNGDLNSGGGARGNVSDGGSGITSGAGGGGGDDSGYDGGNGFAGSNMRGGVGPGGGGGGSGDTTTAIGMGGDGGLYGAGGGGGRYGGKGAPGVIVITYASNTPTMSSWKVPTNWNNLNNTVEVIGAGGAGCSIAQSNGCAGGGGGAYSKVINVALTPAASVAYQIGQGGRKTTIGAGNGQRGSDTFFNRTAGSGGTCEADTTSVCAKGGEFGNGTATAGTGGAKASCDGTTCWSGGTGGIGRTTDASGGGGGAGGSSQDGKTGGAGSASGTQGGGGGGGAGDDSGTDSTNGQIGQATTGGNGGAGPDATGGGVGGTTNGPAGTVGKGGGGAGGFSAYSGGDGGSGSSTLYGGGGGGGAGDNNAVVNNNTYGANGGLFGGGGGGGTANGFGANGIIIVNYTPLEISGVCKQYNQNDNSTEANPIRVAINGTPDANTASCSGGSWTVTLAVSPVDIDDVITVWVDNVPDANEAVAVIKTDGSNNISGVNLYERHLVIGSDDNTIASNSDLAAYDNSVSGNENIFFDVNASNQLIGCFVAGCEDMELYIGPGDKYALGSASATFAEIHDIEIDGTFDMTGAGNYASISGSWWNDATFTPNSSTIFFTASDSTELVSQSTDGTYAFYNLQFGDSATGSYTGHFDLNGNVTTLDVNGNLTIDAGTLHVDTKNVTAAGSLSIGTNGVYTTSTGTFTFDNTATPANWIDSASTKNNMGAVTINGTTKHIDLGSSVKATSVTVGADDTLDVNGSNTLTLSGSGAPLSNSGTFTCSTGTVTYEGIAATTVAALNGANHYYNLIAGLSTDINTFSYTAAGEIEASGSISLIPGSSGVHTFDMGSNNLSVGGAASTGGIAVPAGTVFTQTSGTTKVYSSSGSATIGGAGTTKFYVFQIGNASDGNTYTFNLGGDIGASSSFTLAVGTHTLGLSSYEFGLWGDWTMGSGASLSAQTGTLNLGGTTSLTLTCSTNCEPYNLTINKTTGGSDNVTLASALTVRNTLTITDGRLVQGNQDVRIEGSTAVSVNTTGEWRNIGTGDLTLGGTFANLGSVSFDTSDKGCTDFADSILIRSTLTGTAQAWSGGGTFYMHNLDVQDQSGSSIVITVYDGTDRGNTPNWLFTYCAPVGGGASPTRIKGGTIIKGGTRIK